MDTDIDYSVGTIWRTSWGYDQTNVEFFDVIREMDASVELRRLSSMTGADDRVFPGNPTTDWGLMGNDTRWNQRLNRSEPNPIFYRDRERGYSTKLCRKSRYGALRIDSVRSAYPYEGGGAYETPWGFGH